VFEQPVAPELRPERLRARKGKSMNTTTKLQTTEQAEAACASARKTIEESDQAVAAAEAKVTELEREHQDVLAPMTQRLA
jgi:hypothetical protein